jgi:SHS2 domain-containing protein
MAPPDLRPPRHERREHTGEVELLVEAPTLADLFGEAGRALAELMADDRRPPDQSPRTISLRAPDREALLVAWLDELIFLGDTTKSVYPDLHIDALSDTALAATVRGLHPEAPRTAVKAATYHALEIVEQPGGFSATVVLDV